MYCCSETVTIVVAALAVARIENRLIKEKKNFIFFKLDIILIFFKIFIPESGAMLDDSDVI